ncbi:MAG: FKBP-type peptidyl-prolyl cis-trans isomerase [Proteobacteria bacterium]|nr:FKBP-type peptidyl-prolyl cis-trans isomerase [Pseudomonadota bacterium]NOG60808.1 FKBP-type peptidyl-prolyl cis-trans isomerase [Pseudomonadota bacterium]
MNKLKSALVLLLSFAFMSAHAAKVESELEKLSYSMGIFFGQSISRQGMELDTAAFLQAVEDVMNQQELKLDKEEMQQILAEYQKKEQQELAVQATSNKAEGEKYLAENKKKEGVVSLDSGLQYKVIATGKGEKPQATSQVIVHYRGTLIDGTEFDSSYARGEPAQFGVNQVIKGWQEALQLMPVGSKWQIVIPSNLAYGERGAGATIKPNSTLLFDVELLEIK